MADAAGDPDVQRRRPGQLVTGEGLDGLGLQRGFGEVALRQVLRGELGGQGLDLLGKAGGGLDADLPVGRLGAVPLRAARDRQAGFAPDDVAGFRVALLQPDQCGAPVIRIDNMVDVDIVNQEAENVSFVGLDLGADGFANGLFYLGRGGI